MNLNLRQAIIQRIHDKDTNDLHEVIGDSIDGDERALPGLGVIFEIIWKNSESDMQTQMVSTLKDHLI